MTNAEPQQQTATLAIDETLQQAIAHHQAGRLQDAERLYRTILLNQPNHSDANHNLGVLAVQVKQPAAGLPHFKAALESNPNQGQYWLSYIDALFQTGQADAARQMLVQGRQLGLNGEAVEALADTLEEALRSEPNPQEINKLVTLFNEGKYAEAEELAQTIAVCFPLHGFSWKLLGASLQVQGKDALPALQKTTKLLPDDADVHCYLGSALRNIGRLDDAVTSYHMAVEIKPDYAEAHNNLGVTLMELDRLGDAEASYRRAIQIKADLAEAHSGLGNTLKELGRLGDAESSCRRAIQIKPDLAEAHNNLGITLQGLGRFDEAEVCYRRALQIKPDYANALNNLALLLNAQGESAMALNVIRQSLQIKETGNATSIFSNCVKRVNFTHDDSEIRVAMARALTEPWGRPSELARVSSNLVKLNPDIGGCVSRAVDAWPLRLSAQDLFGANGLTTVGTDSLLCALLATTPICDIELERFLTMARSAMLDAATGVTASENEVSTALSFYSALARQCFINEYLFSYTDDEIQKACELRASLVEALKAKTHVPALWPIAVASYFPLSSVPLAAQLLAVQWPDEIKVVLVQQVLEPAEEQQLHVNIPRLTDFEDEVTLLVQSQYEENPYPRWVKAMPALKAKNIVGYFCQEFPLASFSRQSKSGSIDVLIAGCGTGKHSIGTAQQFQNAQVLAVDLSINSLGYAKRKTQELGLNSIEYAQADLLKLGSFGRSFDVIESVGVLHHLADPWAGWSALLSLLRPGGFMRIGFYSEAARRNIVRIRRFIAEQGYSSTAEDIRCCRQDLMELDASADFGSTLKSPDFFSISTCRDLLFHVQEHRMTLTSIDAFLRANNLTFLGFGIDANILNVYKLRFPDDCAAINLAQWQIFENENPDTFSGMYQFWIQKAV